MKKRKRLLIVIGIVILLAVLVGIFSAGGDDAVVVETGKVGRVEKLVSKVDASGEIRPKEYVELQAEISGVITSLNVEEGDFVKKGDLLLRIDPTQTEAESRAQLALLQAAQFDASNQEAQIGLQETNLSREKANVRAAEADVQRATQALVLAEANFRRKQELFEENLISRDLYEAAKTDKVTAESGLITSKARLEQAQASQAVAEVMLSQSRNSHQGALRRVDQSEAILRRAQDSLSKTTIRSPLTGVITQLNVEVGERAVPGTLNNPAATIMVIADLSVIEAEVEVDETDIVNVALGQSAVVNVDALPNQPLEGVVTEIGNSAIQRQGQTQEAKDFKVVIRLSEPPSSLRPGLSCTADITTAVRDDVLAVPIQALTLRERPVDESGNPVEGDQKANGDAKEEETANQKEFEGVFVIRDGKARFVPITTGITGDTEIEVKTGLQGDEEIITGSYRVLRTLKEGDAVRVEEEEEQRS